MGKYYALFAAVSHLCSALRSPYWVVQALLQGNYDKPASQLLQGQLTSSASYVTNGFAHSAGCYFYFRCANCWNIDRCLIHSQWSCYHGTGRLSSQIYPYHCICISWYSKWATCTCWVIFKTYQGIFTERLPWYVRCVFQFRKTLD